MEHPALNVQDIKEKSLEDLQKEIGKLYEKLNFANRTGNQALSNQLNMVLEVYLRANTEKLTEMYTDYEEEAEINGISIDTI